MSSSKKSSGKRGRAEGFFGGDKILVLVVDIDDDLGKTGIQAPIIGYERVVEALLEFGKKRPDDSDVNALLAALSIYERLRREGRDVEIAVLAGHSTDTLKAMLRIEESLRRLKEDSGFTHIFLVSDGVSDERVLPLLNSYGVVLGVERIIVHQSHGVEETFLLLTKYLKKAVNEQPYARYFLGIPGLLILVASLISILGLVNYLVPALSIIVSGVMVLKGFGVIAWSRRMWRASPLVFFSFFFGVVMYALALIASTYILYTQGITVSSMVAVIDTSIQLVVFGSIVLLMGRMVYRVISGSVESIWMESIWIIPLVFTVLILQKISDKVSRLPANSTATDISRAITSTDILVILLSGIAVSAAAVLLFMVVERKVIGRTVSRGAGSS